MTAFPWDVIESNLLAKERDLATVPPTGNTSNDDIDSVTDNFTEQPTAEDRDIVNRLTAITVCSAVVVVLVLCGVQKERWYVYLPLFAVMVYAAFRRRA
jgi:hypothetical protein